MTRSFENFASDRTMLDGVCYSISLDKCDSTSFIRLRGAVFVIEFALAGGFFYRMLRPGALQHFRSLG